MTNHPVTVICLPTSLFLKANAQLLGEVTLGGRAMKLPLNQKSNDSKVNFEVILDLEGGDT